MLFVFIILIIFLLFVNSIANTPESGYSGKKERPYCPPHNWEYNEQGSLYCKICREKPGYEPRE